MPPATIYFFAGNLNNIMCGIVGVFNYKDSEKPVSLPLIEKMCNIITHRGPDDWGNYVSRDGMIGMGMRRLSIIDIQGGKQPIFNEDRSIKLVFNGEIYNYKELRNILIKSGHRFRSESDSEVIVHGYEEWGLQLLKRLRGMFAFSIWDSGSKTLTMARDHTGIKPLYYWENGKILVWGSEIKSILMHPNYRTEMNNMALTDLLKFRYVPSPSTFFKGILKLPPGYVMQCNLNKSPGIFQYWDIPINHEKNVELNTLNFSNNLYEKIEESVKMHMVSDVPIGAFLSGGIDSSTIVGLMTKYSSQPVKTFSVGFSEAGPYDELKYARLVSNYFQTDHHELILKPQSFKLLKDIVWHFDEPVADPAAIPTYLLSKLASKHVKVVLTGEGADELFAGYSKYKWNIFMSKFYKYPDLIKQILSKLIMLSPIFSSRKRHKLIDLINSSDNQRIIKLMSDVGEKDINDLLSNDIKSEVYKNGNHQSIDLTGEFPDLLHKMLYVDSKYWLPDDLLMKVDKMTMASSLESRVPFLDPELIEFSMKIPSSLKLNGSTEKYILREAVKDILPPEILKRKKHVFAVPFDQWFKDDLKEYFFDILLGQASKERGIFDYKILDKKVHAYINGDHSQGNLLFTILNIELWNRLFLDQVTISN